MTDLAVVMLSKNQAWNIDRLIESVLRNTAAVENRDIVLIDSASTDDTVHRAAQHPIRVLRLRPDQRLTAAAGRYLGYRETKGDLILFLDGDMELLEGWLEQALDVLEANPDIAVVSGRVIDQPKDTPLDHRLPVPLDSGDAIMIDVPHGGGAALYRRAVLEEVGPFNPYIFSDEEPELCTRIRHRGYRVVWMTNPIAFHYTDPYGQITTLFSQRKRRLFLGMGQNIRRFVGTDLLVPYLKARPYVIPPAIGMLAGLGSLLLAFQTRKLAWPLRWAAAIFGVFAVDALRKRSLSQAAYSMLNRSLILEGSLRGFMDKPQPPESYPAHFDVIKPS